MNRTLALLAAAMTAYDAVHALERCDVCGAQWDGGEDECRWCLQHRRADHDHILKPPAERGYGYATPEDLAWLDINPTEDRQQDLERWRHDLELAVDAQLITQAEGDHTWQSANQTNRQELTSSTGNSSTTAQTPTTTPSSTASHSAAAGPPSPHQRKQANRRSSLPLQWTPPNKATPPST